MNQHNQVYISGKLNLSGPLRATPAGIPVVDGYIAHDSEKHEAGHARQVECEIPLIALGETASKLARLKNGQAIRCKGFLAAKSRRYRQSLVLHIEAFELLCEEHHVP